MASSAAICFATFLLGALAVGNVWFPIATQYWNLEGDERRIKVAVIEEIYLASVGCHPSGRAVSLHTLPLGLGSRSHFCLEEPVPLSPSSCPHLCEPR